MQLYKFYCVLLFLLCFFFVFHSAFNVKTFSKYTAIEVKCPNSKGNK